MLDKGTHRTNSGISVYGAFASAPVCSSLWSRASSSSVPSQASQESADLLDPQPLLQTVSTVTVQTRRPEHRSSHSKQRQRPLGWGAASLSVCLSLDPQGLAHDRCSVKVYCCMKESLENKNKVQCLESLLPTCWSPNMMSICSAWRPPSTSRAPPVKKTTLQRHPLYVSLPTSAPTGTNSSCSGLCRQQVSAWVPMPGRCQ